MPARRCLAWLADWQPVENDFRGKREAHHSYDNKWAHAHRLIIKHARKTRRDEQFTNAQKLEKKPVSEKKLNL